MGYQMDLYNSKLKVPKDGSNLNRLFGKQFQNAFPTIPVEFFHDVPYLCIHADGIQG
jgi:hypothetical protein